MPLTVRGGFTAIATGEWQVKTVKSTMYMHCPVWFVNWIDNLFRSL